MIKSIYVFIVLDYYTFFLFRDISMKIKINN